MNTVVEPTLEAITAWDRCDACGSAKGKHIVVIVGFGELLFCNHCHTKHEAALTARGAR